MPDTDESDECTIDDGHPSTGTQLSLPLSIVNKAAGAPVLDPDETDESTSEDETDESTIDDDRPSTGTQLSLPLSIVNKAAGAPVPDPDETDESTSKDMGDTEDIVSHNDHPLTRTRTHTRTYQFHNCQAVYVNSCNARGLRVNNAGNNAPRVACMFCALLLSCPRSLGLSCLAHISRQCSIVLECRVLF